MSPNARTGRGFRVNFGSVDAAVTERRDFHGESASPSRQKATGAQ